MTLGRRRGAAKCLSSEAILARVVRGVDRVTDVGVKQVWTPPWSRDRMTEEAKLELGLF